MQKRTCAMAAGAVFAAMAALTGTSASAISNPNSPGTVTPNQQIVSTNLATPVHGDFDGDGRDDVFWYVPGSGTDYLWSGKARNDASSAERFDVTTLPITGSYQPITGDFNGDDRDDILWYSPGSGADSIWYFTGRGTILSKSLTINGNYQAVVDDFDASDGFGGDDIFWYDNASSYLWTANANETFTSASIANPPDNAKVYIGNFRQTAVTVGAPEYKDLFFYVAGTAPDSIWAGNGDGQFTPSAITVNGSYNPIVGNFDANGSGVDMTDIFWYGPGVAADSVWMNNGTSFTSLPQTVNGRYAPVVVPSREATTQDDIFWDSKTAGDFLWATNGTNGAFTYASLTPSSWGGSDIGQRSAIPGDYNAADALSSGLYGSITSGGNFSCALTSDGCGQVLGLRLPVPARQRHDHLVPEHADQRDRPDLGHVQRGCWSEPRLCRDRRRRCQVLGPERWWSARQRHDHQRLHAGERVRPELGCRHHRGQRVQLVRTAEQRHGEVLGRQLGGSAGQRQQHRLQRPGHGQRPDRRDPARPRDQRDQLCRGIGSGQVLGLRQQRPAGQRRQRQLQHPGHGQRPELGRRQGGGRRCVRLRPDHERGVKCWGSNSAGHLGNGTNTDSNVPVNVTGLTSGVANIFGGSMITCALLNTGVVKCWGANTYGQLSTGNKTDSNVPVTFAGLTGTPIDVSVGFNQTCVLSTVGRIQCVGDGTYGGLGDGTRTSSLTPTEVAGGRSFGDYARPAGNADVLWWAPGDATGRVRGPLVRPRQPELTLLVS